MPWCSTSKRQGQLPRSVNPVRHVRDIGIHIDCDLDMCSHVQKTAHIQRVWGSYKNALYKSTVIIIIIIIIILNLKTASVDPSLSALIYTVSQKVPTFTLFVTLSNLNDFQNFALLGSVWNLLQNTYDITHLTLGMLLHYLGKLKSLFCRYSADME